MPKKVTKKTERKKATTPRAKRNGTPVAAAPVEPSTSVAATPTEAQIRARAYEIFRSGTNFGDPTADWLQAEHELRTEVHA